MIDMAKTFFFYDLETSGLNPREDRIMQFAGIRTDENFQPIGEPYNILVALNEDVLPSPGALMVTGISPQKTVEEGYSEAEFAKILTTEIFTPDTTIVGYNSIRFDDEFIRALLWRNYYDPYEWAYADGRSRWDLLDVVRLTRALRPEGIQWPVTDDGVATNRLELLSQVNGLNHHKAHDALSDVEALIEVTSLIYQKQPKLFNYLLSLRHKNEIKKLVSLDDPKPFVYASGRYDSQFNKTTVAYPLAEAEYGNIYVYDLRVDPTNWVDKSPSQLKEIINTPLKERGQDYQKLPVKKLQYNRAPAVAPLGVLESDSGWEKIGLTQLEVEDNLRVLTKNQEFARNCAQALADKPDFKQSSHAEAKLYDGFVSDRDKLRCEAVRNMSKVDIKTYKPSFQDQRLAEMYVRYKARNFSQQLSAEERSQYEDWRQQYLAAKAPQFASELAKQAGRSDLSSQQQYVLEELKLWFEAIMPESNN